MKSGPNILEQYVSDISTYPLISREEEVELADLIKSGSADARRKLVCSNLRLVVKIAFDFKGRGLPLLDLIAEGNVGLMLAADRFDPAKGAKFSSYASWWIKQCMRRALANQARVVRIPIQSATKIHAINKARQRLGEELDREPTTAELAEETGFSERTVGKLKIARTVTVSLSTAFAGSEETELINLLADESSPNPDQEAEDADARRRLGELIDCIDERKRTILKSRFGLDGEKKRTFEELSEIVGLSRERVRQIQNSALAELRVLLEGSRKGGKKAIAPWKA